MTFLNNIRIAWSWLRPLVETNKISILSLIIPTAKQAILDQVSKSITNPEKKSTVISIISDVLSSKNVDAGSSLIELGFNLAFQALKAEGKV